MGARSALLACTQGASDSRPPGGMQQSAARGRNPQREKERGSEPNEPRARSRSAARREHEGERRSDRTSRTSKGEGAAPGARGKPPARAPTPARGHPPPTSTKNALLAPHMGSFTDSVRKIALPYYLTAAAPVGRTRDV